jgi:hypothetical protein
MTIGVVRGPARRRHCGPDGPSPAVVPSFAGGRYDSYDLNAAPAREPQTCSAPDFTRAASGTTLSASYSGLYVSGSLPEMMGECRQLVRVVLVAQNLSARTAHPDSMT